MKIALVCDFALYAALKRFKSCTSGSSAQNVIFKGLNFSAWNFNGFGSSKARTLKQTGSELFSSILERNDLICFSETWRDPIDTVLFTFTDNFSEFHEPGCRNHLGGRPSGGLSLFVRKSILKYFSIAFSDSYHFWCKLIKTGFGWE